MYKFKHMKNKINKKARIHIKHMNETVTNRKVYHKNYYKHKYMLECVCVAADTLL